MRASWSEKSVVPFTTIFPVMFTLPGIVTTPDESIVSLANPPVTNDASNPVHVVPILAPSVIGYICSNDTIPNPTKGVSAEVVTDED